MMLFDEFWSYLDPFDITDPKLLNSSIYIYIGLFYLS